LVVVENDLDQFGVKPSFTHTRTATWNDLPGRVVVGVNPEWVTTDEVLNQGFGAIHEGDYSISS
jgi:hypothetical protein